MQLYKDHFGNRAHKLCILLFVPLLLGSCSSPAENACELDFQTVTVTVLMPDGKPAESVVITVTEKETGEEYDPCEEFGTCEVSSPGQYIVFHDGFADALTEEASVFVVNGVKGDRSFSEEFWFRDDGCGHVEVVAGSYTIHLSGD